MTRKSIVIIAATTLYLSAFLGSIVLLRVCSIPENLDSALIAEDTAGDITVYRNIVACVRNRLRIGLPHGLTAMNRKDLSSFVEKECQYALATKNIDLRSQARRAIFETFVLGIDYCDKATHYEHTGAYSIPEYTKNKNVSIVKILFKGTEKEITFWRKR